MVFLKQVAVLCHFIVFVFLSLKPVAIGFQIQWTQFLIMEPFCIFNFKV